mmetsp:Transcript_48778/g.136509  ORF Transcript_48778/g.136509 Transcript_48778/m.136509 type:complete len:680 (-) Transcript_48778:94-2133(-)
MFAADGSPNERRARRHGRAVLLDVEGLASATVSAHVDAVGAGPYALLVLVAVGSAALSESVEMGASAPMHTALAQAFELSDWTREALPALNVAGSAVGMCLAGPLCDHYGRKTALIVSNVMIAGSMIATSVLPLTSGPTVILWLRFFGGMAASVGGPAGSVLAVESVPRIWRAQVLFAITFLSSIGYLICAVGLQVYMPYMGDSRNDNWRGFFAFVAVPAMISLPIIIALSESPSFLAVIGQRDRCAEVLCRIACINGQPLSPEDVRLPLQPDVRNSDSHILPFVRKVYAIVVCHASLLMLLSFVDASRGYFITGSSYIWKDYFAIATAKDSVRIAPSMLNIVASVSPLVGVLIGERFVAVGVRRLTLVFSMTATCMLLTLTSGAVRDSMWAILWVVVAVKITYGPLTTCVMLIKTEAFPTEIRVTAVACVTLMCKVGSAVAPTVVEMLRGDAVNTWKIKDLNSYVVSLACAAMLCGLLVMGVPGKTGDGVPLEDYVVDSVAKHDALKANSRKWFPSEGFEGQALTGDHHVEQYGSVPNAVDPGKLSPGGAQAARWVSGTGASSSTEGHAGAFPNDSPASSNDSLVGIDCPAAGPSAPPRAPWGARLKEAGARCTLQQPAPRDHLKGNPHGAGTKNNNDDLNISVASFGSIWDTWEHPPDRAAATSGAGERPQSKAPAA